MNDDFNVISTTIMFNGLPIKIENGKIFTRSFGTSIYNKNMHWSWMELDYNKLKPELKKILKERNLV